MQMAAAFSEIVRGLPVLLNAIQTVTYIFLVLFLGSIVVLGLRIYMPFWKRFLFRIGFGILALFSGAAIAPFMPLPDSVIVRITQTDMMVGGIVSSVVFAVSLYLISRALPCEDTIKRAIQKLEEMLRKEQSRPKPKDFKSSPFFLAGAVVIILMVILSAATFTGFPSIQSTIYSEFGITQQDLEMVSDMASSLQSGLPAGISDVSSGCLEITDASLGHSQEEIVDSINEDYENPFLQSGMEQMLGEDIIMMRRGDIEGTSMVIGVSISGSSCLATETEVCLCNRA